MGLLLGSSALKNMINGVINKHNELNNSGSPPPGI